jgi:hypothetical protein
MSGVFQNIDPPTPLTARRVCTTPPPFFGVGGGHTRWVERGVGGQYFGRLQKKLCTLHMQVLCGWVWTEFFGHIVSMNEMKAFYWSVLMRGEWESTQGFNLVMLRAKNLKFYTSTWNDRSSHLRTHTGLVMKGHKKAVNGEITKNPRRLKGQIQHPSYQSRDNDTTPWNQKRKHRNEKNPVL